MQIVDAVEQPGSTADLAAEMPRRSGRSHGARGARRAECPEQTTEVREGLEYCARCGVLARVQPDGDLIDLRLAGGYSLSRVSSAPVLAGYRTPARKTLAFSVTRRWFRRFGLAGAFLALWGGGLASFAAFCVFAPEASLLMSLLPGLFGLAPLYVAAANLLNRTRTTVSVTLVTCEDGPLRWRRVEPWSRGPSDRVTWRVVRENDIRNASARWPAPQVHEVVLRSDTRELVLFDQILRADEAEAVATTMNALIARSE